MRHLVRREESDAGESSERIHLSHERITLLERLDPRMPHGSVDVTSPSFCTTANERVYITTSSGKGANGGSQGAVGDRRAAICGAKVTGAGGL
jgi:hypothetical protein